VLPSVLPWERAQRSPAQQIGRWQLSGVMSHYFILPWLDTGLNTPLLFGIQLLLLMPTNWSAISRYLQPSDLIDSFLMSITDKLMLHSSKSCTLYVREVSSWGTIPVTLVLNPVLQFRKLLVFSSYSVSHKFLSFQCLLFKIKWPVC
jgi:hypothetical protein